MEQLQGIKWGVISAAGVAHLICPDRPNSELSLPIDRQTALVAGYPDQGVGDDTIRDLNRSFRTQSRAYVFGHPMDIKALSP